MISAGILASVTRGASTMFSSQPIIPNPTQPNPNQPNSTLPNPTQPNPTLTNPARPTYAQTVDTMVKKEEDAIILPAIPGIHDHAYAVAVAALVGPRNVFFVSKISNGRVIIFLKDETMAQTFVNNHPTITVGTTQDVPVRLYVNPAIKLRIAQSYPFISNQDISEQLKGYVDLISPIQYQKSGIRDKELSHICNLVRFVYIKVKEEQTIPETISITHNGKEYRLFLTIEDTQYLCKQKGHYQHACPNQGHLKDRLRTAQAGASAPPTTAAQISSTPLQQTQTESIPIMEGEEEGETSETSVSDDDLADEKNLLKTPNRNKRRKSQASSITSTATSTDSPAKKMTKMSTMTSDSEALKNVVEEITIENLLLLNTEDISMVVGILTGKNSLTDLRADVPLSQVKVILDKIRDMKLSKNLKSRVKSIMFDIFELKNKNEESAPEMN